MDVKRHGIVSFKRHLLGIAIAFALGGLMVIVIGFGPIPLTWRGLAATFTAGGVATLVLLPDSDKAELANWKWVAGRGALAGSIGGFTWWLVMGADGPVGWPIIVGAALGTVLVFYGSKPGDHAA